MHDHLNGIFLDTASFNLQVPNFDGSSEATRLFEKNLPLIAFHSIASLERIPVTYSQTLTISRGYSVSDLSIKDLNRVHQYILGLRMLSDFVRTGLFTLNSETACQLHAIVAHYEVPDAGALRKTKVIINNVAYLPPPPEDLQAIADKGFQYLRTIKDPKEQALGAFLFLTRNKLFEGANRRIAFLMMNGILLSHGYSPLTILQETRDNFERKLVVFYETGNATPLVRFFEAHCMRLFGI